VCALCFAALIVLIISSEAQLGLLESVAITLLFQEVNRSACYANSSTMGGLFLLMGLCVPRLLKSPTWVSAAIAGVLFGVGGWCRLDSLVLAPCLLPLFWRKETPARAVALTSLAAAASLATLVILFRASDADFRDVFGVYSARVGYEDLGYRPTVVGLFEIASLGSLFLAGVGLLSSMLRRNFFPALLLVSVLAPTLFLYSRSVGTPKYLYYLTPALALLAAHGLGHILAARRLVLGACALGLVGLESLTGIRTTRVQVRRFDPQPTLASLSTFHLGPKRLQWVVGPGEVIANDDGFSLWTGLGYSGLVWHREKETAVEQIDGMHRAVDANPQLALLTTTYASYECAAGYLRQKGYRCEERVADRLDSRSHLDRWVDGARLCRLGWINQGDGAPEIFADYFSQSRGMPSYFFNDLGVPYATLLLKACPGAKLVGSRADGLFALYQLSGTGQP
jgi:hypothetical protein